MSSGPAASVNICTSDSGVVFVELQSYLDRGRNSASRDFTSTPSERPRYATVSKMRCPSLKILRPVLQVFLSWRFVLFTMRPFLVPTCERAPPIARPSPASLLDAKEPVFSAKERHHKRYKITQHIALIFFRRRAPRMSPASDDAPLPGFLHHDYL